MRNGFLGAIFGTALFALATQASATVVTFDAVLSGTSEIPANASFGTGFARLSQLFTMNVSNLHRFVQRNNSRTSIAV
jgi:hypothetical protein